MLSETFGIRCSPRFCDVEVSLLWSVCECTWPVAGLERFPRLGGGGGAIIPWFVSSDRGCRMEADCSSSVGLGRESPWYAYCLEIA